MHARFAVLALLLGTSADAAPVVDLEVLPTNGFFNTDNDTGTVQEFVAGIAGTLTRIDVFVRDDIGTCETISCGLVVGTSPGARSSSANIFLPNQPPITDSWLSFVLDTPIEVVPGQSLFFDIDHDNVMVWAAGAYPIGVEWDCLTEECIDPFDPLTGGRTTLPHLPELTHLSLPLSYAFRTWVRPATAPIPEPSAYVAFALGLLVVVAARSRRRLAAPRDRAGS
jgi:hypothetical protein